jgi:hypothetical protein
LKCRTAIWFGNSVDRPSMPSLLNNVRHWLDRAEEARAVAGQMNDPEAKRVMLGIAAGYERMAKIAEERLAKSRTATKPQP